MLVLGCTRSFVRFTGEARINKMAANRSAGKVSSRFTPVGIYLHIPFCEKKCFYCDFYSLENHSQRDEFTDSIVNEIHLFAERHPGLDADTIFFGGGTPSLLTPLELDKILSALHEVFHISGDAEFTMECNPGATDTSFLSDYRSLGANRLSFGVQSFFDDELRFLSRIHNSEEAMRAVSRAREAGFENVNIDLIYALPGQTEEKQMTNLQKAISLRTEHVSAYSLIVEPGTPLYAAVQKGEVTPADESREAGMYEKVMEFMEGQGYCHYEISNYAQPGFECKHNMKYWNAEEYVGFGPSAHSYLEGRRWWNVSSLTGYVAELGKNALPVSAVETLSPTQLLDEFVILHLRQGVLNIGELSQRFELTPDRVFLRELETAGYCIITDKTIRLTRKGFTVCDEIAQRLLASLSLTV